MCKSNLFFAKVALVAGIALLTVTGQSEAQRGGGHGGGFGGRGGGFGGRGGGFGGRGFDGG